MNFARWLFLFCLSIYKWSLLSTQIKFDVSGRELVIPLSNDQVEADIDRGYSREVVQRILAVKDQGHVSDKAFHALRKALPENVRSYIPPLSAILKERRNQNKD